MINAIDNGLLTTDLDAAGFFFLNVTSVSPVPDNLVATDDIRLVDDRVPLDGSVTNASVVDNAAIAQDKLNLNGDCPPAWIGFDANQAAPGDLTEYLLNKNAVNGYAGLDGSGLISVAQLPGGAGTGTVTSVALAMPSGFSVAGSPITTNGTFLVTWDNVPDGTWFGNSSGLDASPIFNAGPITVSMVPDLPADKITSGTVAPERLPIAVGVGTFHSAGAVPDPGDVGNPEDYLARDMTYKPLPTIGAVYQPVVPDPTIALVIGPPIVTVQINSSLTGVSLFYKITGMTDYLPTSSLPFQVNLSPGQTVDVYGAKAGYTNSSIVFYVN